MVLNVVTPTLTAYLPEKSKATGTGVIIAPGGYCVALAISQEGDAARWLQSRGIAAFVLKYRIIEKKEEGAPKNIDMDEACKYGIADGIQAIKVVRQHAAEWSVSPDRIGFMGFLCGRDGGKRSIASAGCRRSSEFCRADLRRAVWRDAGNSCKNLPPIFMAWAQDDDLAGGAIDKFYDALKAAGNKPEAHIFSSGGHGFGIKKQGTTSDHWIDEFYYWLEAQGLTKQAAAKSNR